MLLIPLITWWTESRTCVSHKYMFPQIALLLNHTNYHPYQPFIKVKGILFTRMTQQPSGGSRGGGQGAQAPPLYFDQNGAQRAGKKYFETAPPPPLSLSGSGWPARPLPPLIWRTGSATASYEEIKTQVNVFQIHCRHFISTSLK